MAAHIARLRIAGFKSFADPATIEVRPGLTGVIGPNGCGKSNVVEALRWAMGESSARALRGGEMDDLIFAGTGTRPARNLAEVTLSVEEAAGLGPAPFEAEPELQIARRAERGSGSDYRINGRAVRARDVQTLFADLSSGARSSAMVSQNRVGQLIAAKPEDRRATLEEAAGITGLHVRRHDAELKLRQTETNLARAEDQRTTLERSAESLSAQSGQAQRYRTIAAALREAEANLEALVHARAIRDAERATDALARAKTALSTAETEAERATIADHEATRAVGPAREAADTTRAALERLRVQAETALEAIARAEADAQGARERAETGAADLAGATRRHDEMAAERARLEADRDAAILRHKALPEAMASLRTALERAAATAETQARAAEAQGVAARQATDARDRHEALLREAQETLAARTAEVAQLEDELETLTRDTPDAASVAAADSAYENAVSALATARTAREDAEAGLVDARLAAERAKRAHEAARTHADTLAAEDARLSQQDRALREQITQHEAAIAAARKSRPDDTALAAHTVAFEQATEALATAQRNEDAAAEALSAATQARLEAESAARDAQARQNLAREALAAAEKAAEAASSQARAAGTALENARSAQPDPERLAEAEAAQTQTERAFGNTISEIEAAEARLVSLRTVLSEAEEAERAHNSALVRLRAQHEGLIATLAASAPAEAGATGRTAAEALDVPEALIAGVAVALGDGLDAALPGESKDAARRWVALPPVAEQALPDGAVPLASLIAPPAGLERALGAIGLVPDAATGARLHAALQAGQTLITAEGALWRADGLAARAGAPSPAARRLAQQAQLAACAREIAEVETQTGATETALNAARTAFAAEDTNLRDARTRRQTEERAASDARSAAAQLRIAADSARARLETAQSQHEQALAREASADATLQQAKAAVDSVTDHRDLETRTACVQAEQNAAGAALSDARRVREAARAQLDSARAAREDSLAAERSARETLGLREPALENARAALAETQSRLAALADARANAADPATTAAADAAATAALTDATRLRDTAATDEARARDITAQAEAIRRDVSERAIAGGSRISALSPRLEALRTSLAAARDAHAALLAAATQLEDPDVAHAAWQDARAAADAARVDENALRAELATVSAEQAQTDAALEALTRRIDDLGPRLAQLAADKATLEARVSALRAEAEAATHNPASLSADHAARARACAEAEDVWRAADRHAEACVRAQSEAAVARREADAGLARARAELTASAERATQAGEALARLLGDEPDRPPPAITPEDLSDQTETSLKRKIARLLRERDDLGPVNLRADLEFDAAREQLETLTRECGELTEAIERLRGSIGSLNKEGRARLSAVFAEVDKHFQTLFSRMFGGGRAHLALIGSDDPLEAGLEIYAQPPGKRLSALSLLSGGEQALTALSLIFATHLCNPAPICVLDEVDAPLDDANVERFCALLADMAAQCGTRFLVVTHHQTTMAHMDRLYGVTMQERGVSRVLSVDLSRAVEMVAPA
jgi:chromosome segregation protein